MTSAGTDQDTYRTCFLRPAKSDRSVVTTNETLPTCNLVPGDGAGGGTDIFLGRLLRDACFRSCLHLRKIDPSINGMTVKNNVTEPGCWCERRSVGIRISRSYSTCRFIFNDTSDTSADTSGICRFQHGAGVSGSPLKHGLVGRMPEQQCVKTCVNMKIVNPDINGITISSISKRCWCESSMKSIGRYRTCFIE